MIALDHTTVAALRAHRDRQQAEAASYGPGYRASGFVFTNLTGDPMAPDRLTRLSRKLAAEAGLPPVRLHDLDALRIGPAELEDGGSASTSSMPSSRARTSRCTRTVQTCPHAARGQPGSDGEQRQGLCAQAAPVHPIGPD